MPTPAQPYVEIPLSGGRLTAIIDAADAELVKGKRWHAVGNRYARTGTGLGGRECLYLHRLIMNPPPGVFVDHINNNGLDCRRSNLRLTDKAGNCRNRPPFRGFKGVSRDSKNRWRAAISANGTTFHIGLFKTPEEAARAYDIAAVKHHGEFAWLNFPAEVRA